MPGSPLDPRARGTNDLIRQGAALCEGAEDVLRALAGRGGLAEPAPPAYEAGPIEAEADLALIARLADLLSPTPVSRDELARLTSVSAAAVSAALIELAVAGRAELLAGGLVTAA